MSSKWERREAKYNKERYGMQVSNRSIKTVILFTIGVKAAKASKKGKKS